MKRLSLLLAAALIALGASSYLISPSTILVNPGTSLQAAVNAFVSSGGTGGVLQLGPGTYTQTGPLRLPTYPPISIIGVGNYSTTIDFSGAPADSDLIIVNSGSTTLQHFRVVGCGSSGLGKGIVLTRGPSGSSYNLIDDVQVYNSPSWALYVCGLDEVAGAPYYGVSLYPPFRWNVTNCAFDNCSNAATGNIYLGNQVALGNIRGCHIGVSNGIGIFMNTVDAVNVDACAIEGTGTVGAYLKSTRNVHFNNCWFEFTPVSVDTADYRIKVVGAKFPGQGATGTTVENTFFVTGYKYLRAVMDSSYTVNSQNYGTRVTNCWGIIGGAAGSDTTYVDGNSIYFSDSTHAGIVDGGGVVDQKVIRKGYPWGVRMNAYSKVTTPVVH